jgi:putative addiction module component (TIGR02574 family)
MPDTATELALRGKQLPREERERLVDELLESLNEPAATELDAAWSAEIERRLAAYDRGEAACEAPARAIAVIPVRSLAKPSCSRAYYRTQFRHWNCSGRRRGSSRSAPSARRSPVTEGGTRRAGGARVEVELLVIAPHRRPGYWFLALLSWPGAKLNTEGASQQRLAIFSVSTTICQIETARIIR